MIFKFLKEKLSKLKNRLFNSYLVKNIFTKVNVNKFLIIFTVGIISRAFVNNICGINVYVDFLHFISILYYIAFSLFIVVVHDLASYTEFSLISVFRLDFFNFIISKIKLVLESFIKLIFTTIKNSRFLFSKLKYDDFKISSIRKVIKDSYFNFKDKMYLEDLSNDRDISHNTRDTLLNTYVLNKNKEGSSNSHSSTRAHSSGRHHSSGNSRSNSSSNGGIRNNDSRTIYNNVNTSNNVVQYNTNNTENIRLNFLIDTFNDGRGSRAFASPAPSVARSENHNSSFRYATLPPLAYVPSNGRIPEMPRAPIPSNLSTPSTMTPLFESPRSVPSIPKAPVQPNLSTPSTMSPLFPPQENLNYQAPNNQGLANNTNTGYSSSHYSNSIASTPAMDYSNAISRARLDAGYSNTPRYSTGTNNNIVGLNASNERV
jgi:hypothetical protein